MMNHDDDNYLLIYAIVNLDHGSRVLKLSKEYGIPGGTIVLGKGTARGAFSRFLGLDISREIVMMVAPAQSGYEAMSSLKDRLKLEKPGHGIIFAIPVCDTQGSMGLKPVEKCKSQEVFNTMHQIITVIVDKGRVEDAMEAALEAGSRGGTIINARGADIHETSRIFAMDIEPEKEILLILSKTDETEGIVKSIKKSLDIDAPGNGIIYVQNVAKAYGINEGK